MTEPADAATGERRVGRARRRLGTLVLAVTTAIVLTGCFPCEGVAVTFPDDPLVVGGTWAGVAASDGHPDLGLLLMLDVAYVDPRSYAVAGILELEGGVQLEVEGHAFGFCEQRFEPSPAVARATPAPEAPRFEATLFDSEGAAAGSLLAYRVGGANVDPDAMTGELRIEREGSERTYHFAVERQ